MYLKRLEIHGFKSFADKVIIEFNKGITGIVGPNGSGKSNIIDSVRWVLGEQSPKTLRGSKMEDIIFNGTTHRKPLGMAEVSLVFDNKDKILPIEYTEVNISRRIYRSGESEYLINKTPCRLRDIRELIMDTGIGIDGYSLIGQGEIDKILSNKPEDRRRLFEEAAGIVKFKTRKYEAEKKLDNTCQNLIRIEDIIKELELRLGPLKNQSDKAQNYLKLSNELKDLELKLFLNEIDDIKLKLKAEEEQFNIVETQLNNNIKENNNFSNKRNHYQEKIEVLENDIKKLKDNYYETNNTLKKLDGRKLLFNEKIENINKDINRVSKEINEHKDNIEECRVQLSRLNKEREDITDLINGKEEILVNQVNKYKNINNLLSNDQNSIESYKSEVIEILNNISSIKSEINSVETIKENIIKRITKIRTEKSSIVHKKESLDGQLNQMKMNMNEINESIKESSEKKSSFIKEYNELNTINNDLVDKCQNEENSLRDMMSQKKIFESMEKSYEGFNSSVKKVLEVCNKNHNLGQGVHGVVAELINIPKGLEIAIEVSLGYSMQYIVCNNKENAKNIITYLKKNKLGRVTFLPISDLYLRDSNNNEIDRITKIEGYIGKADELISFSKEFKSIFQYLLGRTLIVKDIDIATRLSNKIKNYKIVNLDGDIINPSGTITGGSYKQRSSNIFTRKRKIKELTLKIEEVKHSIDDYNHNVKNNNNHLSVLDINIKNLTQTLEDKKIEFLQEEGRYKNIKDQLLNLNITLNDLNNEMIQLESEIDDLQSSSNNKLDTIDSLKKKQIDLQNIINKESDSITVNRMELESLNDAITTIKIDLASLKEKRDNNLSQIQRSNDYIGAYENEKSYKVIELDKLNEEKKYLSEELENTNINIKDNNILIKQLDYNISKLENTKKDFQQQLNDLNYKIDSINNTINELRESLHKIEVKKTRFELQQETIIKKIWEKYELSYIESSKYDRLITDINEASKRIKELDSSIKKLGEVNLTAIEEYKEVNKRYLFLDAQRNDLINAKNSLNKVIKELEETMEKQFIKYFQEINENFKTIFNKLFNGGKAELKLDEQESILESNIEIVAQPPGKKLQNLNLLSGGEKALTAIALLFSILKTKPTPFCILDEIEAALDDVNIFRFADFLKEFSQNSQFIIITHRKGTMEIIDYLYGVTMHEYGVSKIVSVKLSERAS